MLVVATGPNSFGPRRTAIQRRLRRFHNRRIVRALAFYQGWWGVRPKSPVTSQPPCLVDLLYREDPHILCFREACQQPSLPSLFGMPHGHSLSCLLIRRYRMSAVTFCFSTMCSAIPTSPDSGLTSRCGWTAQAKPPICHEAREQSLSVGECDRVVDITPLTVWPLTFMLPHKAVLHGCRHLLFTTMCFTIPTSPAMAHVSPHGAAGQQKQPPCPLSPHNSLHIWTALLSIPRCVIWPLISC